MCNWRDGMWRPHTSPQTEMRTFFRRYYTHARYISATKQPIDELKLDGTHAGSTTLDTSQLYIDLRPYMNRCGGEEVQRTHMALKASH